MARPSKADRLNQIAEASLVEFRSKGFRLAQVADIARRAGVAPGTIYLFAEGKEQLFWLAFARAMNRPLDQVSCEPPSAEELRKRLTPEGRTLSLSAFIPNQTATPPFETLLRDFWTAIEGAAAAINLVEKCALDWPELASAFYFDLRPTVLRNLSEYFKRAGAEKICRPIPNTELAARIVIETMAWFAIHRLGDADGKNYDPIEAREATIEALLHAYGAPAPTETP